MSLQERLNTLTQGLDTRRIEDESGVLEKELAPVRLRIKELEDLKYQLELVVGSLMLKQSDTTGFGMRAYSNETLKKINEESALLDRLVDNNREALQTLGVTNRAELIKKPEFAEEAEIINYNTAKNEAINLETSDSALRERLATLGVATAADNFTYDVAEKALIEKLQAVADELLLEKLKTPEGKEYGIDILTRKIEKDIPPMSFSENKQTTGSPTLSFGAGEGKITILRGVEARFDGWNIIRLLPTDITTMEQVYGREVVRKSLLKAYGNKIELNLGYYEAETNSIGRASKQYLEKASPEKRAQANSAFDEFEKQATEFKGALTLKAEQLRIKKVTFNPTQTREYGSYERFALLCEGPADNSLVKEELRGESHTYPPRMNFDALKEYIEKRTEQIKNLTNEVKKLETQQEVNDFIKDENSSLGKAYTILISTSFDDIKRLQYDNHYTDGFAQSQLHMELSKFRTYEDASIYFARKDSEREMTKQVLLQAIDAVIAVSMKGEELSREIKEQKLGQGIEYLEKEISDLNEDRKGASELIKVLDELKSKLPNELVSLSRGLITVPSVGLELDRLYVERDKKTEELKNVNAERSRHSALKPKFFGMNKWESNSLELSQQQKNLEGIIDKLNNELGALSSKRTFQIPINENYRINNLVNRQKKIEVSPNEVFAELMDKLKELVDRKVPDSIVGLYKEYRELEKNLTQ